MGSDYGKDMYRQMMELYSKVEALTASVETMKEEIAEKDARIEKLEKENSLLKEEVSLQVQGPEAITPS